MPPHISFQDVDYSPSLTGVRIRTYTDVPCHLFCRVTIKQPWIHKKAILRRGLRIADDVRFCFTVFEDNEQFEPGDTTTHTFWKTAWPPCTTKWFYFWGTCAGVVSPSTSPLFKYHNTGEAPVPPPDTMYQLNPIDPQYYSLAAINGWKYLDLSRDIPEGATGALIQLHNIDIGQERNIALRKPGANYDLCFPMIRDGTLWSIVGLDYSRRLQFRSTEVQTFECYVLAYTGRDVVFPDDPIDIKPTVGNVQQTQDIGSTWPEARLLLTDLGSLQDNNTYHGIRALGSAKANYGSGFRKFPFTGVPVSGLIETFLWQIDHPTTQWVAYAYFKKDTSFILDGVNWGDISTGTWQTLDCTALYSAPRFAFLEYYHPAVTAKVCCRKNFSYYNFAEGSANHSWMITHVHHGHKIQVYGDFNAAAGKLFGIAETH